MAVLSDIRRRLQLAWAAGMQAEGARNMYKVFGWKPNPEHKDYVAKYLKQDITQRIISAPVNALWSDPPTVTGDATFQKSWDDLLAQHAVFHQLQRVDILCGLGRYAVMLIGLDDGLQLDKPVRKGAGRKVIYLQPYAEGSAVIKTFDRNQTSPRFGLPLMYTITPGAFEQGIASSSQDATIQGAQTSFDVHYSRILHIAEGALESEVFGHSRLQAVYNVLDDVLKVTGGSAEMFWLSANRGLHIDVDKEMDLKKDDAENLSDEIDEYEDQLRRVIRTRGVTIKSLGSEVADPRGVFDVQLSLLASNTGIPKRVLAGSEAGQLASQQDRANWAIQVEMRIAHHGQPTILIPFIRTLIDMGVLSAPSQMSITWPDAFKMNPLERAQTSAQMARSAANLSKTLKTVQDINLAGAEAARATFEATSGGGGFMGNATTDSVPAPSDTPKPADGTTNPAKPEPGYGSPTKDPNEAPPGMIARPPLMPKFEPLVLLTEEECRKIIGFGKHMPVFDDKGDSSSSGSTPVDPQEAAATALAE